RDPGHGQRGRRGGQEQVEHRLVDAQVEAPELDRDPGIEFELVLGFEVVVAPRVAEDRAEDRAQGDPAQQPEEDLGAGPHRAVLLRISPTLKYTVKSATTSTAAARPASLSDSPTSRI